MPRFHGKPGRAVTLTQADVAPEIHPRAGTLTEVTVFKAVFPVPPNLSLSALKVKYVHLSLRGPLSHNLLSEDCGGEMFHPLRFLLRGQRLFCVKARVAGAGSAELTGGLACRLLPRGRPALPSR